jgi:hypothetical protein
MVSVRNISTGPRGAYLDGVLVEANPGEVIDADDFAPEWFEAIEVDGLSDDELDALTAPEPEAGDKPKRGRPRKDAASDAPEGAEPEAE